MCIELEAFPAAVKSKHGCPVCGGKKWGSYRLAARNSGYVSARWGVAEVDLAAEGFSVFHFYFDECLSCGTVVS
jgi:hypothetical protein